MLQRLDGRHEVAEQFPAVYAFRCGKGHETAEATALTMEADFLSLETWRTASEDFTRGLNARCGECGENLGLPALAYAYLVCEFEDGAGSVVAWYAHEWRYGYAPGARAVDLVAKKPRALGDLGLTAHLALTNEDCRGALGRVFSVRTRWVQLVERFLQRGRPAIADNAGPGYALFVYETGHESAMRAIARVFVPEYDPVNLHVHGRLDPEAHRFFPKEARAAIRERKLVLEAVVDTDEVLRQIEFQRPRFGDSGDVDAREAAAEAIARSRLAGEQVFHSLAERT